MFVPEFWGGVLAMGVVLAVLLIAAAALNNDLRK